MCFRPVWSLMLTEANTSRVVWYQAPPAPLRTRPSVEPSTGRISCSCRRYQALDIWVLLCASDSDSWCCLWLVVQTSHLQAVWPHTLQSHSWLCLFWPSRVYFWLLCWDKTNTTKYKGYLRNNDRCGFGFRARGRIILFPFSCSLLYTFRPSCYYTIIFRSIALSGNLDAYSWFSKKKSCSYPANG